MFSHLILLFHAFAFSGVLAAPSRGLSARIARRAGGNETHKTEPLAPPPGNFQAPASKGPQHIEYSGNWAGAVLERAGDTWKTVTGTFIIPEPELNPGQTWASASAWVGIDGDSCQEAILQAGVDFSVDSNGHRTYDAWYEWFPDYAYDFPNFPVCAGETVTVTVTAYSTTSGIATIYNHNTKQTATKTLSSSYPLCEQDAEWIVERYELGGSLVPLADWGRVHFKKASATTNAGKTVGPNKDVTIVALVENGEVVTKTKVKDSHVDVYYV